jgi:hypothetical protein
VLPDGGVTIKLPAPRSAADELPLNLMNLHVSRFFRAAGSALDCVGALIVGVLALPTPILKADLGNARRTLRDTVARGEDPAGLLSEAQARVDALISSAGPRAWLQWANDYRNMLVHRGRRLNMHMLVPNTSLSGPDGRPVLRAKAVHLLTRDPARSDIESLVEGMPVMLSEPAETTLNEVFKSTVDFMARQLATAWIKRRATPKLLPQPRSQWPQFPSTALAFDGYEPGRDQVTPNMAAMAPDWLTRLKAAALAGNDKEKWKLFD